MDYKLFFGGGANFSSLVAFILFMNLQPFFFFAIYAETDTTCFETYQSKVDSEGGSQTLGKKIMITRLS